MKCVSHAAQLNCTLSVPIHNHDCLSTCFPCNGPSIHPSMHRVSLLSTLMHVGTVGHERTLYFLSSWSVTFRKILLKVWKQINLIDHRNAGAADLTQSALLWPALSPKLTLKVSWTDSINAFHGQNKTAHQDFYFLQKSKWHATDVSVIYLSSPPQLRSNLKETEHL